MFDLEGTYRVQSRRVGRPSRLVGRWGIGNSPHHLDEYAINVRLAHDPAWRGTRAVKLRPAFVEQRAGEFEQEPDILYKVSQFIPAEGKSPMPTNIVDVAKALSNWDRRVPVLRALIGQKSTEELQAFLNPRLARVIANEYFVHEAGHAIGYDTESKYADGYFKLAGKTVWPLIYVEEFRADLLSFAFASDLLDRQEAAAVFVYNVFLRLGVHTEGLAQAQREPYGPIPTMLYALLREFGWLVPGPKWEMPPLRVGPLAPTSLVELMSACAARARAQLLTPELAAGSSATDAALVAAHFYRSTMSNSQANDELLIACRSAAERL
ncbi:hypothetical protein GXW74_21445 [Roseomonas eburnea]|uniref:Uncharacterized protein n=1 Tax=Neoroseomonas eburnea TaxID=1346889 RepID=A0A9X9XH83_9PROT|nr:hypothetical protein [Neoroseomonas eburnea]MBR0683069.1 hypothetical protein [Neoroseomonas eburnea]